MWRREGWPETWKEETIVPVVKKGRGEVARDYRVITIVPSMYKIYALVLTERLRKEVEEKRMLSKNQIRFRKGKGTMDNIFVLKYLINRQLKKKGGKLIALFVDLKAAFDTVSRKTVVEAMKERGVRKELVERIEEVLRETRSRVRIGGGRRGILDGERGETGMPNEPDAVQYDISRPRGGTKESEVGMDKDRGGEVYYMLTTWY